MLAVIRGTIIQKLKMEKYIDGYEEIIKVSNDKEYIEIEEVQLTKKERVVYAKDQVLATIKKVWLFILIGVGIGAIIHNFIPQAFIETVLGQNNYFSVL